MRLTPVYLSQQSTTNVTEVTELRLAKQDIDSIDDLSCCIELRRLDLSNNQLSDAESTDGIKLIKTLTWLNLAHNQLNQGQFLRDLTNLVVLNLSNNSYIQLPMYLQNCTQLKALVLNNNDLHQIEHLGKAKDLNTLVLSHNKFEELPALKANVNLIKLSASFNSIRTIPDLSHLAGLRELRLSNNKILAIPESFRALRVLEILDLGLNLISNWKDIATLSELNTLVNLNLKGNKICQMEDYTQTVKQRIPSLRVLDTERFDQRFLHRKQRQKFPSGGEGRKTERTGSSAKGPREGRAKPQRSQEGRHPYRRPDKSKDEASFQIFTKPRPKAQRPKKQESES
ncbi:hypothetical protein H4R33_000682 [Dimargaris cristalligena]|uniref:Protein phosphatase 1 regulatory subunit 7 n=1 Tax=Dimargaris cristalligena TaxID=215637 RepID=A0A4Q0A407_9FUNG|nr:hypothetical protein H4R33_000682 [Dimargaris cristalligena]RKP40311.1 hypothetical protein BJ085DRAFT_37569 [Dimargaris cristalligena]|eukprot:RKP40311.1 hypothetical protein BJ085DRAFT_37569 [Dimargaris cristalligena]